jgi:hypothetical protein
MKPLRMTSAITENQLQKQILDYLRARGIVAWRPNQSYRKGRFIPRESIGTPDIVGVTKDGRFLGIEVKVPKTELSRAGKVSKKQQAWIDEVKRMGGRAFVARSIEEVANEL